MGRRRRLLDSATRPCSHLLLPLRRGGGRARNVSSRTPITFLDEEEFFIRKAIGRDLRDMGRKRPEPGARMGAAADRPHPATSTEALNASSLPMPPRLREATEMRSAALTSMPRRCRTEGGSVVLTSGSMTDRGRVRVEQVHKRVRAYLGGELVADTDPAPPRLGDPVLPGVLHPGCGREAIRPRPVGEDGAFAEPRTRCSSP